MTLVGWELRKLRAQLRVRVAVTVCALGPPLLALVLHVQTGLPKDTLFGRHVLESGFALPLVVLGFCSTWVFPLLASAVAGDIFASEDVQGTWQSLLTRSRSRQQVFVAKAVASLCATAVLTAVTAASSLLAGLVLSGDRPLPGLSGTSLHPSHAVAVVLLCWLSELPPLVAFTALAWLLSVAFRNPLIGVGGPFLVGLLMQLLSLVGAFGRGANVLLTAPLTAWHGLPRDDPYYGPLWQGALVSVVWAVPCAVAARRLLLDRDIT